MGASTTNLPRKHWIFRPSRRFRAKSDALNEETIANNIPLSDLEADDWKPRLKDRLWAHSEINLVLSEYLCAFAESVLFEPLSDTLVK